MENKIELRNKIYHGIKTAIEKLISKRIIERDFLIVSKNGKIIKIPAIELKKK